VKVKICGVCRPEDARAAAEAGADYVGVILASGGPRTQTPTAAAGIYAQIGSCSRVGVFADQPQDEVCALAESLGLDVVQLHGREDAEFVARVAQRTACAVWKTVWLQAPADLVAAVAMYGSEVAGLLLDAAHKDRSGGTGTAFDWTIAAHARTVIPPRVALIVAGGLNPTNVKAVIFAINPDVVDVASGVEDVTCKKSLVAVRSFVRNAKS
jgi:phosphoribosylanthranilate isomerase